MLAAYLYQEVARAIQDGEFEFAIRSQRLGSRMSPRPEARSPGTRQRSEDSVACVYYYCHYTRNHDEAPHFLRWVVCSLSRQSDLVPSTLLDLHHRNHNPSTTDLLFALGTFLEAYDAIFIVLDAIDESKPRYQLLDVIRHLASDLRFARIRLLITSRIYIDIEESIGGLSLPLSLSNELVEDDIRKYIYATIEGQRASHFRRLSDEFLHRVCGILASKSQGMLVLFGFIKSPRNWTGHCD